MPTARRIRVDNRSRGESGSNASREENERYRISQNGQQQQRDQSQTSVAAMNSEQQDQSRQRSNVDTAEVLDNGSNGNVGGTSNMQQQQLQQQQHALQQNNSAPLQNGQSYRLMAATIDAQNRILHQQKPELEAKRQHLQSSRNPHNSNQKLQDDDLIQIAQQNLQNFKSTSRHEQWRQENQPQHMASPRQPPPVAQYQQRPGDPYYNYPPSYQHLGHYQQPHGHPGHYQPPPDRHHTYHQPSHVHHNPTSPSCWQCNQCSRWYPSSVNVCVFCSVAPKAVSDQKQTNVTLQRQQPHQPSHYQHSQGQYPGYPRNNNELAGPNASDFQPPTIRNNETDPLRPSTSQSQQQYQHPRHHNPLPSPRSSPGGSRNRTKKVAQKSHYRSGITDDLTDHADDSRNQSKYFQPNTAGASNQAPPRGKIASALERLRHQDEREHCDSNGSDMEVDNTIINGYHRHAQRDVTESPHVTLNKVVDTTESLPQLEGIRYQLKALLGKVEDKINRALVKRALDECGLNNARDTQQSQANSKVQVEMRCPLCFSPKDANNDSITEECPICDLSSVCQDCQSTCIDCGRACCKDCIQQCGVCNSLHCPDCKTLSTDKSTAENKICKQCLANASKTIQEQNVHVKKRKIQSVKDKPKQKKTMSTATSTAHSAITTHQNKPDPTNIAEKSKAANHQNKDEAGLIDDAKKSNGIKAKKSKVASHCNQDSDAPVTVDKKPRNSDITSPVDGSVKRCTKGDGVDADINGNETKKSKSSPFLADDKNTAIHLITVLQEGTLGIRIGPDRNDHSYTRVTEVDSNSQAEMYGLRVGDLVIDPHRNEKTDYETTKTWLMDRLKTRPVSFSVRRKYNLDNDEHQPIYAFDSKGKKHLPQFDDSTRASIHTFVINPSSYLPFGVNVGDLTSSEDGYSYTCVKKVQPGSLGEKHGILAGDIISKVTDQGRLVSGLTEWIAAKILSGALFRLEVIRITKVPTSPQSNTAEKQNNIGDQRLGTAQAPSRKEKKSEDAHPASPVARNNVEQSRESFSANDDKNMHVASNDESQNCEKSNATKQGGNQNQDIIELSDSNDSNEIEQKVPETEAKSTANNTLRPLYGIGTKLQKKFLDESIGKRRYFKGEVVSYDYDEGFYKIVYDDGDEEELNEEQITKLIERRKKHNRPFLKGKISFSENNIVRIYGHWNFEHQPKIASQTFELIRSTNSSDETTLNGEYSGWFIHEYEDQERNEVRTTEIKESKVIIEFTPKHGDNTFLVKGKGMNQYGIFQLEGEAEQGYVNGQVLYQVKMYKTYVVQAASKY